MTAAERVREEMRRFEVSLPHLKARYADRWVVFRDGAVVSDHDTEEDAYRAGLTRFGRQGGHVVARVADRTAVPLSAAVVYQKRG
jgi:hypothetical protein